jgi:hypothetical protein
MFSEARHMSDMANLNINMLHVFDDMIICMIVWQTVIGLMLLFDKPLKISIHYSLILEESASSILVFRMIFIYFRTGEKLDSSVEKKADKHCTMCKVRDHILHPALVIVL